MSAGGRITGVLLKLTTESDNLTPDILRYIALAGVVVFLGLSIANWEKFEPQEFGIGLGAVLAAAGLAVRMNEPPTAQPPEKTP